MKQEAISIPFKMDPLWAIKTFLKLHFNNNYNLNNKHTIAVRYSLSEVLYSNELTEDEIQEIGSKYSKNHNLGGNINLSGEPEQIEEMFSYIFDLERYKEEHWKNILAGNGPYEFSVIDLKAKKEYETDLGEHWVMMLEIIKKEYKELFDSLTDDQKDEFMLNAFKLIGKSYSFGYYTNKLKDSVSRFGIN